MKLGQKVKCKSYIKRLPRSYIVLGYGRDMEAYSKDEMEAIANGAICMDDDTEYEQQTHKVAPMIFEGLIMGRRKKSMTTCFDAILDDQTRVSKVDYIDCFLVAYSMGGTRLVPVNDVEKIGDNHD